VVTETPLTVVVDGDHALGHDWTVRLRPSLELVSVARALVLLVATDNDIDPIGSDPLLTTVPGISTLSPGARFETACVSVFVEPDERDSVPAAVDPPEIGSTVFQLENPPDAKAVMPKSTTSSAEAATPVYFLFSHCRFMATALLFQLTTDSFSITTGCIFMVTPLVLLSNVLV